MAKLHHNVDMRLHILEAAQPLICAKGYTAVGLKEILQAAEVPKGSFYHYFESKDAFGEALLLHYFDHYLSALKARLTSPPESAAERLLGYWRYWQWLDSHGDPQARCLVVKLAAEVSDLSETMRFVLQQGTAKIIGLLADCIQAGIDDQSLPALHGNDANIMANCLYQLWLGASLRAKIIRDGAPCQHALWATHRLLGLTDT